VCVYLFTPVERILQRI